MNRTNATVLAVLAICTFANHSWSQTSVTQSLDPASPEVATAGYDAASMNLATTPCPSPAAFPWTRAALGVPAGGNLDAFADGTDIYPPLGHMLPGTIPGQTQVLLVNFSVDRTTTGVQGTPIASEAAGNGAAGDTFLADLANGGGMAIRWTDHLCLTPLPSQSNIDAICWNWSMAATYPVYYSVDAPTAAAMQGILPGVNEADIIRVGAPGAAPTIFASRAELGLAPGDDIDALAYTEGHFQVVYSLSRTSPTAIANPLVGSAGLFSTMLPAALPVAFPWALAFQLGMNGGVDADNLDAVRIAVGDPWPWGLGGASIPGGDSCNGVRLSSDRPVLGLPLNLTVMAPVGSAPGMIASSVANTNVFTLNNGCNLYLDPATGLVNLLVSLINGASTTSLVVPNVPGLAGAAFRIQAAVIDAGFPGGFATSNPVTLVVGAF